MKKAIILAAAIAGCSQNEGQQAQPEKLVISDTLRFEEEFGKTFCVNCGKECRQSIEPTGAFELTTGKPLYHIKIMCPNSTWYNGCRNDYKEFDAIGIYRTTGDRLKKFGVTVEE